MHIQFQDGIQVPISLNSSDLAEVIKKIFKHLQHVALPFRDRDSYLYILKSDQSHLVDQLIKNGQLLDIFVDREKCMAQDQEYLNHLHKIYECNYDGDPIWLDYHEYIHLCEFKFTPHKKIINLDFREKAGLLEQKFDMSWLKTSTTKLNPGDVFVSWAELGKTPFAYWKNNEPDDLDRLCQLAKPWLKLRPKMSVAFEKIDHLQLVQNDESADKFNEWWSHYHDAWCDYWEIDSWSLSDMFSYNVVGHIDDLSAVENRLMSGVYPCKVTL